MPWSHGLMVIWSFGRLTVLVEAVAQRTGDVELGDLVGQGVAQGGVCSHGAGLGVGRAVGARGWGAKRAAPSRWPLVVRASAGAPSTRPISVGDRRAALDRRWAAIRPALRVAEAPERCCCTAGAMSAHGPAVAPPATEGAQGRSARSGERGGGDCRPRSCSGQQVGQ